jgi:hypothetical protein
VAFLPAGLIAGPVANLLDLLAAVLIAGPVAGLAFFAIARPADLLHAGFLDHLVAGVPAFFENLVPDQFVAGATLLLACREATLCIAAWVPATSIFPGTAIRCGGVLNGPEQADQCSQQRRSQAHPHDFASSKEPIIRIVKLGSGWCPSAGKPTGPIPSLGIRTGSCRRPWIERPLAARGIRAIYSARTWLSIGSAFPLHHHDGGLRAFSRLPLFA